MDTTYYTFQSRKIKASGGAELVTFVPAVQPAPQADDTPHAGEVLNFDLCRRRLETRSAWKDLTAAAHAAGAVEITEEQDVPVSPRRPAHGKKARAREPWAEILASAIALGFVCLVGAVALLSIV